VTVSEIARFRALGLSVIPLGPQSKKPDADALPRNGDGVPTWVPYQSIQATDAEISSWFGNGIRRNAGIICGPVSGVVAVETDSNEAEAWASANLPRTPMMTRSARGTHRFYRLPTGADARTAIPRTLDVDGVFIEVKGYGQYVLAPGSVHPGNAALGIPPGHIYREVEPWPESLAAVPEFPMAQIRRLLGITDSTTTDRQPAEPLPRAIDAGDRNNRLFREGCRLRRLGFEEDEIAATLAVLNRTRCDPRLDDREVEAIAHSCCRYDPAADTFPLTETGDAEFFVACNADTVRYDHRRGRWLLFNGHVWVPQTDGEVARLALDAIRARQRAAVGDKERLKWAAGGESRKRQANLLALAQSIKPVADSGDSWDLDPWLLGAPNGVIDLRTGTLRFGQPDDRITMRVRVPFDASARCPLFDTTVFEIFEGNRELIEYIDRYIGYSLTADCREESLAFCWGEGANGKGTLLNTIGWLLGDYADDLPFSAFELQNRSGIPNDIAKIVGKRFITASETGETQRLNEARVKALTGRDPITARFLHKEFFTFQPVAKFWLSTNHKPEVHDDSDGFWRRLHLTPFAASFIGREDRTLKDRLRVEGPGILARAVRGCLAWQDRGLNPPAIIREATQSYRADSAPLTQFIDECCQRGDDLAASFNELFTAYKQWAGKEARLGKHTFNKALRQMFQTNESDERRVQHGPVLFKGIVVDSSRVN
jgi:P4 family phage/plasmid primase-like protien